MQPGPSDATQAAATASAPATAEVKWSHPFWLTFKGRSAACMEAEDDEAVAREAADLTGCEVLTIKRIPYPAHPRLRPFEHPKHGVMPAFCFRPEQCRGTSCPQPYACTE